MKSRKINLALFAFFVSLSAIGLLPTKSYSQQIVVDCGDHSHTANFWRHRCLFHLVGLPESVIEIEEIRMDVIYLGTAWQCGSIFQVMNPGYTTKSDEVTTIEVGGENLQYVQVQLVTNATKYLAGQPLTWDPFTTGGIGYVLSGSWLTDPSLNASPATGYYSTEGACA